MTMFDEDMELLRDEYEQLLTDNRQLQLQLDRISDLISDYDDSIDPQLQHLLGQITSILDGGWL